MVILDTAMQEGHRCKMQAQDEIQQQQGTNKNIGVRNEHDIVLGVQCGWRAMWNEAFWFVLGMGVGPECVVLLHTVSCVCWVCYRAVSVLGGFPLLAAQRN